MAFVPVGWVVSAAVFGSGDDGVARTRDGVPIVFDAGSAQAGIGRSALIARVRGDRIRLYERPVGVPPAHAAGRERPRPAAERNSAPSRAGAGKRRAPATPTSDAATSTRGVAAQRAAAVGRAVADVPRFYDARVVDARRLPIVFAVRRRHEGWLQVELPTRPNFSTAWVRAKDVRLRTTPYALRVDLERHRLTLLRDGEVAGRFKVGLGRSVAPTPKGRYYLTDLIKPKSPNGLYGAYAFGLSGHSRVLTSFGTGDGQIGLHGTNDPSSLGRSVSHGCIRVSNELIRRLARDLPLGTPVVIR